MPREKTPKDVKSHFGGKKWSKLHVGSLGRVSSVTENHAVNTARAVVRHWHRHVRTIHTRRLLPHPTRLHPQIGLRVMSTTCGNAILNIPSELSVDSLWKHETSKICKNWTWCTFNVKFKAKNFLIFWKKIFDDFSEKIFFHFLKFFLWFSNDDMMMGGIRYMELTDFNVYRRNTQKMACSINLYLASIFHCNSNIFTGRNRKKRYFIQNNNLMQFLTLNIMIENCLLQFAWFELIRGYIPESVQLQKVPGVRIAASFYFKSGAERERWILRAHHFWCGYRIHQSPVTIHSALHNGLVCNAHISWSASF